MMAHGDYPQATVQLNIIRCSMLYFLESIVQKPGYNSTRRSWDGEATRRQTCAFDQNLIVFFSQPLSFSLRIRAISIADFRLNKGRSILYN